MANNANKPQWDSQVVELQLKYSAVLDTAHIRKNGYSCRIPFTEFMRR
jgi:myosin heavy subunit